MALPRPAEAKVAARVYVCEWAGEGGGCEEEAMPWSRDSADLGVCFDMIKKQVGAF